MDGSSSLKMIRGLIDHKMAGFILAMLAMHPEIVIGHRRSVEVE